LQSPVRNEHEPHARIGLDVGGTKTAGGLVLFPEGQVVARRVIPTRPNREAQEVLQDTLDLASGLIRAAESMGRTVEGIGAGVAELVTNDGEITSGHTIPWRGLPVR
jgi:glucokinase